MTSDRTPEGSGAPVGGLGDLVGIIRRRLLVNRWVDPGEIAPLLPSGVRPREGTNGGVVAGCCLITLDSVRPWPMPAAVGLSIRAAAHRISVQVGPALNPVNAVYVPMRHSDSRPAVLAGGRVFPGVHGLSTMTAIDSTTSLRWRVEPTSDSGRGFAISAEADLTTAKSTTSEEAQIVVGTFLGVSPDHGGALEGAEMRPVELTAEAVELTDMSSEFLDGFTSATEAESLLMTDVGVSWCRAGTGQ